MGHTLLSYEHLLVAIDDKVATLVIAALFGVVDVHGFGVLVEPAVLGSYHDGYLAHQNLIISIDCLLVQNWLNTGLRILGAILELLDLYSAEHLSLVREASHPASVGHYLLVGVIVFKVVGQLVDCRVSKDHLICTLIVVFKEILPLALDLGHSELLDDFLDRVLQESLKGEDLLGDEAVLLEVTIDHVPAVFLVDWIHIAA